MKHKISKHCEQTQSYMFIPLIHELYHLQGTCMILCSICNCHNAAMYHFFMLALVGNNDSSESSELTFYMAYRTSNFHSSHLIPIMSTL